MKKMIYQAPEVKIKTLFMEQLMTGSITANGAETDDISYGNEIDNGDHEVDAKLYESTSVWDD